MRSRSNAAKSGKHKKEKSKDHQSPDNGVEYMSTSSSSSLGSAGKPSKKYAKGSSSKSKGKFSLFGGKGKNKKEGSGKKSDKKGPEEGRWFWYSKKHGWLAFDDAVSAQFSKNKYQGKKMAYAKIKNETYQVNLVKGYQTNMVTQERRTIQFLPKKKPSCE